MSSEVLTQAVGPAAPAAFGQGRIFNLLSAPGGAVSLVCDRRSPLGGQTQPRNFKNVPAGTKYTADRGDEWTYLRLTSASIQQIVIFIGDEDVQFNNAVTVTGTAAVTVTPSTAITDTPAKVVAINQNVLFAANAARRRITVYSDPNNAANTKIFFRTAGGANNIGFITPGTYQEFDTVVGLDTFAAVGGDTLYLLEES